MAARGRRGAVPASRRSWRRPSSGVPDPYRGETVKAYVSLKAGAQANRRRDQGVRPGTDGRLQIPPGRRDHRRDTQERQRQGAAAGVPRKSAGRPGNGFRRPLRSSCGPRSKPARYSNWVWWRRSCRSRRSAPAARSGLYRRLETMLTQVRADGNVHRPHGASWTPTRHYHQYLIDLADNEPLSDAFAGLGLRELYEKALQNSDATSEQAIVQHELLTDAVAAGNAQGAHRAILTWTEAAQGRVRIALGVSADRPRASTSPGAPGETFKVDRDVRASTRTPRMDRAALAQALDARAAVEIGVLRLIGDRLSDADRELLSARLLVRTPLLRGDDADTCRPIRAGRRRIPPGIDADPGQPRAAEHVHRSRIPRLMRETITNVLPAARAVMDDHTGLIAALRSGDTEAACGRSPSKISWSTQSSSAPRRGRPTWRPPSCTSAEGSSSPPGQKHARARCRH